MYVSTRPSVLLFILHFFHYLGLVYVLHLLSKLWDYRSSLPSFKLVVVLFVFVLSETRPPLCSPG